MFIFGRKAGIMGVVLMILAALPLLVTIYFVFQMPDQVPTHFTLPFGGTPDRFGSRWEMMIAPVVCLGVCLSIHLNAGKQAALQRESKAVAIATCERYLRNGIVTGVVLNVASFYVLLSTMAGLGWF